MNRRSTRYLTMIMIATGLIVAWAPTAVAQTSPGSDAPAAAPAPSFAAPQMVPSATTMSEGSRRPSLVMPSLYASTVLTQALDAHSTFSAIDAGAREGNPLIGRLAHHRPGFLVLKGAIAASAIYLGHDMAKSRKKGAVLALVALNGAYAALVVHNYRIAARMTTR